MSEPPKYCVIYVHVQFVPGAQAILDKEIQKEIDKIEQKMLGDGDSDAMLSIPGQLLLSCVAVGEE